MLQRHSPSAAARRFYNAFYRWSLLQNQQHTAAANRRIHLLRSSFLSSHPRAYDRHAIRFQQARYAHTDLQTTIIQGSQQEERRPEIPPKWLQQPVQSSADLPLASLETWGEAIRYRSDAGIVVQTALPGDAMLAMEQKWGARLAEMQSQFAARIEIGPKAITSHGAEVVSLLYSGSMKEALAVRTELLRAKAAARERRMEAAARRRRTATYRGTVAIAPAFSGAVIQTGNRGLLKIQADSETVIDEWNDTPNNQFLFFIRGSEDGVHLASALIAERVASKERADGLAAGAGGFVVLEEGDNTTHGPASHVQVERQQQGVQHSPPSDVEPSDADASHYSMTLSLRYPPATGFIFTRITRFTDVARVRIKSLPSQSSKTTTSLNLIGPKDKVEAARKEIERLARLAARRDGLLTIRPLSEVVTEHSLPPNHGTSNFHNAPNASPSRRSDDAKEGGLDAASRQETAPSRSEQPSADATSHSTTLTFRDHGLLAQVIPRIVDMARAVRVLMLVPPKESNTDRLMELVGAEDQIMVVREKIDRMAYRAALKSRVSVDAPLVEVVAERSLSSDEVENKLKNATDSMPQPRHDDLAPARSEQRLAGASSKLHPHRYFARLALRHPPNALHSLQDSLLHYLKNERFMDLARARREKDCFIAYPGRAGREWRVLGVTESNVDLAKARLRQFVQDWAEKHGLDVTRWGLNVVEEGLAQQTRTVGSGIVADKPVKKTAPVESRAVDGDNLFRRKLSPASGNFKLDDSTREYDYDGGRVTAVADDEMDGNERAQKPARDRDESINTARADSQRSPTSGYQGDLAPDGMRFVVRLNIPEAPLATMRKSSFIRYILSRIYRLTEGFPTCDIRPIENAGKGSGILVLRDPSRSVIAGVQAQVQQFLAEVAAQELLDDTPQVEVLDEQLEELLDQKPQTVSQYASRSLAADHNIADEDAHSDHLAPQGYQHRVVFTIPTFPAGAEPHIKPSIADFILSRVVQLKKTYPSHYFNGRNRKHLTVLGGPSRSAITSNIRARVQELVAKAWAKEGLDEAQVPDVKILDAHLQRIPSKLLQPCRVRISVPRLPPDVAARVARPGQGNPVLAMMLGRSHSLQRAAGSGSLLEVHGDDSLVIVAASRESVEPVRAEVQKLLWQSFEKFGVLEVPEVEILELKTLEEEMVQEADEDGVGELEKLSRSVESRNGEVASAVRDEEEAVTPYEPAGSRDGDVPPAMDVEESEEGFPESAESRNGEVSPALEGVRSERRRHTNLSFQHSLPWARRGLPRKVSEQSSPARVAIRSYSTEPQPRDDAMTHYAHLHIPPSPPGSRTDADTTDNFVRAYVFARIPSLARVTGCWLHSREDNTGAGRDIILVRGPSYDAVRLATKRVRWHVENLFARRGLEALPEVEVLERGHIVGDRLIKPGTTDEDSDLAQDDRTNKMPRLGNLQSEQSASSQFAQATAEAAEPEYPDEAGKIPSYRLMLRVSSSKVAWSSLIAKSKEVQSEMGSRGPFVDILSRQDEYSIVFLGNFSEEIFEKARKMLENKIGVVLTAEQPYQYYPKLGWVAGSSDSGETSVPIQQSPPLGPGNERADESTSPVESNRPYRLVLKAAYPREANNDTERAQQFWKLVTDAANKVRAAQGPASPAWIFNKWRSKQVTITIEGIAQENVENAWRMLQEEMPCLLRVSTPLAKSGTPIRTAEAERPTELGEDKESLPYNLILQVNCPAGQVNENGGSTRFYSLVSSAVNMVIKAMGPSHPFIGLQRRRLFVCTVYIKGANQESVEKACKLLKEEVQFPVRVRRPVSRTYGGVSTPVAVTKSLDYEGPDPSAAVNGSSSSAVDDRTSSVEDAQTHSSGAESSAQFDARASRGPWGLPSHQAPKTNLNSTVPPQSESVYSVGLRLPGPQRLPVDLSHPDTLFFFASIFSEENRERVLRETNHPLEFSKRQGTISIRGGKDQVQAAWRLVQDNLDRACADGYREKVVLDVLQPLSMQIDNDAKGQPKVKIPHAARTSASVSTEGFPAARSHDRMKQSGDDAKGFSLDVNSLTEKLKTSLRTLTNSVVVVTSRQKSNSSNDSSTRGPRGVTISSFTTVTMSPDPYISFNLRCPSRSWDAISASHSLNVYLLSATPLGAATAHLFTQPFDDPTEPFRRVASLGDGARPYDRRLPDNHKLRNNAVLAEITADLLKAKCTTVGDHVIVVAKVVEVRTFADGVPTPRSDLGNLTYAQQSFKGMGQPVEMLQVPDESTIAVQKDGVAVKDGPSEKDSPEKEAEYEGDQPVNDAKQPPKPMSDEEAYSKLMQSYSHAPDADGDIEEADYGTSADTVQSNSNEANTGDEVPPSESSQQSPASDTDSPGSTASVKHNEETSSHGDQAEGGGRRPWGIMPSSKASFSTLAGGQIKFRSYSTSSKRESDEDYSSRTSSQVADPSILSSTVSDFLGMPDTWQRPTRMRALIKALKEADQASQRLEIALADGSLTEEESANLEDVIARNERRVAKTLALRSAYDLRHMLDKGSVDVRRAQWLESSVEKGLAIVLDEARKLRQLLDDRAVDQDQFVAFKATLQQQHSLLSTEAMRLRQMVDEEGEGGFTEQEGKNRRFDGFKGNV